MKKILLALSAVAISASVSSAQTLALFEEFSGENCAPCAQYNPALWTLINANPTKVMLIKYQCPIPTAGPIYNAYKTVTNARLTYYSISSAPSGDLQGKVIGTGHIADLKQSDINTAAAATPPFTITATHAWSTNLDSITANITVSTPAAFGPTGANLKLRVALIEHLVYPYPPGTNGEFEFHNVVREMYPDAGGTQLPNSWTASQSQNFVLKGKVPAFVDRANSEAILVVWVQNDADKTIYNTAKSTKINLSTYDAGTYVVTPASRLGCGTASVSMPSTMTLKNTGSTTLTSAKIYYRTDATIWGGTPVSWTGSLAPGATASVTIPALPIAQGTHYIFDSVDAPNASIDKNPANNTMSAKVLIIKPTTNAVPISANFEAASFPTNWYIYDGAASNYNWLNGTSTGLAHNGSNNMPWYKVGTYPSGAIGYLIMPTPVVSGPVTLDFYQAFAQNTASNNDKLEVIYSNDCGVNWTSLWSAAGSALATTTPTTTYWLPSPSTGSADWKLRSVSLNSLTATSILAFRATAGGGNNLFIDDVNIRAGSVGVKNIVAGSSVSVYPNPARESATLEFNLSASTRVTVSVIDAVGRTVSVVSDAMLQQGAQRINIPTSSLAAGAYNITIRTEEGIVTQRLSVVK